MIRSPPPPTAARLARSALIVPRSAAGQVGGCCPGQMTAASRSADSGAGESASATKASLARLPPSARPDIATPPRLTVTGPNTLIRTPTPRPVSPAITQTLRRHAVLQAGHVPIRAGRGYLATPWSLARRTTCLEYLCPFPEGS